MKIGLTHAKLDKSADFTNSYTLASISAWIKKTVYGVEVVFSENVDELLLCDEVWCTSTSEAWGRVNKLGKIITEHGKKFLVGGHHATALPETLRYGVAYRGALEGYSHLDELPLPDWSLFHEEKKQHMIMTSRGCPYDCKFCSSKSFWKSYDVKSPCRVIEELLYLKEKGSKEINIFDDLFTANKKRLREIVELIEQHGLNEISYSCLVRSNTVDQEVIDLLRRMNVRNLAFGAESGSDRMLGLMNKKATVANHQKAIDLLNANNIKPTLSFIAGYPGETPEDLELTKRFIDKNRAKCGIIEIYPCIPFPGTKVWDYFTEKYGISDLGDFPWEALSVSLENIDWDRYFLLTDHYEKRHLIEAVEWNYTQNKNKTQGKPFQNFPQNSTPAYTVRSDEADAAQRRHCPVCKGHETRQVAVYENQFLKGENLSLFSCQNCASLFYDPFPSFNYANRLTKEHDKFYLEFDAGLILWSSLFAALERGKYKSMLDIGCGLGLAMDIAAEMLGVKKVIGLEPSYANRVHLLDHRIVDAYFPDGLHGEQQSFDLILASEVIEHVPDPESFLKNIAAALSDEGVAILTTPNGAAYELEEEADRYAMARPGQHLILLSDTAITNCLNRLGFFHKFFLLDGKSGKKQMVVYFSKSSSAVDRIEYQVPGSEKVLACFDEYLVKKIRRYGNDGQLTEARQWFYEGCLNKLLEVRVNRGRYERCREIENVLVPLLRGKHGVDVWDLKNRPETLFAQKNSSFEQFIAGYPSYLGRFHYFYGVFNFNHKKENILAYVSFITATRLIKNELRFPQFFANKELETLAQTMAQASLRRETETKGLASPVVGRQAPGKKKIKVLIFSFDGVNQACATLRLLYPLKFLKEQLEGLWGVSFQGKRCLINTSAINGADLVIFQRCFPGGDTKFIFDKCVSLGKPVIYEIDDLLLDIPKENPNMFLSEKSNYIIDVLKRSDAVTVTTDELKKRFIQFNKNIFVLPNLINENVWTKSVVHGKRKEVVVGYAGTATHTADLREVEEALSRIARKYGESVRFVFMGCSTETLKGLPGARYINFEADYAGYAEKLQNSDIDIMVVPLADNDFNRCKSNIKWIEFSSCGIAGIYSDLPPYNSSIENGKTGILVQNTAQQWFDDLELLIQNKKLRQKIVQEARQEVLRHFTLAKRAQEFLDVYEGVLRKKKMMCSIIIPVFNKLDYTRKCLEALRQNTEAGTYELIIVDNASTDGTAEFLAELEKTKPATVLSNPQNIGFAGACNQGAKAATTPFLLFLNNDTEPQKGWLAPLLEVLVHDPGVAAVGSKLLFPDGTIQHAGVIAINDRKLPDPLVARHVYYRKPAAYGPANVAKTYQILTAASLLVRRDVFGEAGGFDEGYWNGYEDVDLCFKLGEMGYRLVYQPASVLIHHESVSGPERFAKVDRNIERLHDKWLNKVKPDVIIEPDGEVKETGADYIRNYSPPEHVGGGAAKDAPARYAWIQELLQARQEDRAVAELQDLLAEHQDFALAHNDLGVLFLKRGEADKALAHFRQATALAPANTTFQKNLAEYYLVLIERPDLALAVYSKILAIEPGDIEILLGIAHACRLLNKIEDAADFYQQILKIEQGNPDALQGLAELKGEIPAGLHEEKVTSREEPASGSEPEDMVSIVILTFNQRQYTEKCIASIRQHTPQEHEIIFVDNGSTDGTVKWLRTLAKKHANYRLIENKKNLGFAKGCNQGMAAAEGKYLLLLNNDVVVTPGWLAGLLACHQRTPQAGIVGPMTNNISGVQRLKQIGYTDLKDLDAFAAEFARRNHDRRVPVRRVVGFCMLFTKALTEEIGPLDESFGSGNYEDDDFCLRTSMAGYQNVIAGDVFIHHFGSVSFIGNKIDHGMMMTGNRKVFQQKWEAVAPASDLGRKFIVVDKIERAKELYQMGRSGEAVELLLKVIAFEKGDARPYHTLAALLIDAQQLDQAVDLLAQLPDQQGDVEGALLKSYALAGLKNTVEAEKVADWLAGRIPTNARLYNLQGMLAHAHGEQEKARSLFLQATKADPGLGEPYTNLGLLAWQQGNKEVALDYLEQGFMLSSVEEDIFTNYHSVVTALGEYERAADRFEEALALHPKNQRLLHLAIDILLRLGRFEAAMEKIETAMTLFGIDGEMLAAALQVRERIGPHDTVAEKGRDAISLCMIVKNEEKHIARCLASVKPVVQEMIVADTGSTDRTVDIARALGAKVFDFTWRDDFSAARNFSIEQATGGWILIMDGDEVLSPRDYPHLVDNVTKARAAAKTAFTVITHNYMSNVNTVGWMPNDGAYPEKEAGFGWFPSYKVRLFPNDPAVRFEYPVHELVDPSLKKNGYTLKLSKVVVHHYGKLDEEKTRVKGEAYYEMGRRKLTEEGDSENTLRELAIQATGLKKYDQAIDLLQRLIGLAPEQAEYHVNLSNVYWESGNFIAAREAAWEALRHDAQLKEAQYNLAISELCLGNLDAAVTLLEKLIERLPGYIGARFMLAVADACSGLTDKARENFATMLQSLKVVPASLEPSLVDMAERFVVAGRPDYALTILQLGLAEKFGGEKLRAMHDELTVKGGTQEMSNVPG